MKFEFPTMSKTWAIGSRYTIDLFAGEVEITEKVDGSQFGFGLHCGNVVCRSKGAVNIQACPPSMFNNAIAHVLSMSHMMKPGYFYFGETLNKPKHNALKYNRVPKNHIALFAVMDEQGTFLLYDEICEHAALLNVDVVPLLYRGVWGVEPSEILKYVDQESFLGGPKIEGVVVKNYTQSLDISDRHYPILCGKYVSEAFKEVAQTKSKSRLSENNVGSLFESYHTEARWHKAIQHLREQDRLKNSPSDIGFIIREIHRDVLEEEEENIKDQLWNMHKKRFLGHVVSGFPEFYKKQLVEDLDSTENEKQEAA